MKMKFWELHPLIDDPSLLADEQFRNKWHWFCKWLEEIKRIVNEQQRSILDAELPEELVVSALWSSKIRFVWSGGYLRCFGNEPGPSDFSAVEAFLRFGGHALDEAYEYGSYRVEE